jgi:Protein of unknown function (DUF2911)
MKKLIIILFLFAIQMDGNGQIAIPQLSPAAKIEQQIGLAKVELTYSRPSLKGRNLLGTSYIPNGKVYRMGANEASLISFSEDMKIENQVIPKGKYALMAIPDVREWTIILNKDDKQWGAYQYKEAKDALRFKVPVQKTSQKKETLSFSFEETQPESATLVFRWENVEFGIKLSHDADAQVMAEIKEKTSKENPNMTSVMEAAEYYLLKNRDLPQALAWSERVLKLIKSPFRFNLKAQIAQKMGNCEIAKEAAQNAIEYAKKSNDAAAQALAEDIIKSCDNK